MNKLLLGLVMVLMAACFSACGSSSSTTSSGGGGSSDAPTITSMADLPKATSPMAAASADISKHASKAGIFKAATTGLNLLSAKETDFETTDSMPACETFNVVKDSIVSAAQADMILCRIQAMSDAFHSASSGGQTVDVYDGQWHIFNMSGDEGSGPDKVRMKIVKNPAGNITSFTMFACQRNDDGSHTQTEYVSQTLSGTSFGMIDKGQFSDSEWSGSVDVDVTGTLNTSNIFTQKQITMKNTGGSTVDTNNRNWQEATLTQTPGGFVISGYQKGVFAQGGYSNTYQQAAYGQGEMLGDTSTKISDLAMGDGAVNVDAAYTFADPENGSGTYNPDPNVFAWLGDTLAVLDPASGSSFYSAAAAGTIPTPADSVAFKFVSPDQVWDCNDDVVAIDLSPSLIQAADPQTACSQYGSMDHSWIDCYQAIGQYVNDEPEEQPVDQGCASDAVCQFPDGGALQTACTACFPSTDGTYTCLTNVCAIVPVERYASCVSAISVCQ